MDVERSSRLQQMFDLLIDEIEERLRTRREIAPLGGGALPSSVEQPPLSSVSDREGRAQSEGPPEEAGEGAEVVAELRPDVYPPMFVGPSHAARLMARLALGLLVVIIVVNIPFNRHGTTLATALPDSASLIVRDGLVVKEENSEKIFVYQGGRFRWISSLDAFEHHGFTWGDVRVVQDGYLVGFDTGSPLHVLLKCPESPHIYRLEGGTKRWIRDLDVFIDEGHVWEDVRFVQCQYLRDLPDGETVPPDSGPSPQP